ncbi:MAG: transglycosylase SLT domain-containing protein [Betaproteobacteria bacterium]|nr:transglycosylase SLT domain-containing protein [Betaproteobacteria bacterium]
MQQSVSDAEPTLSSFRSDADAESWLRAMSPRLASRMPDEDARREFLLATHYEAKRAGLDPQLVLGVIQVESNFRKYAISRAGARGFMQVMPFWVDLIGTPGQNLFHLRTSLRYGCTILRHYLDIEKGNLSRALARYNGSLGKGNGYAQKVIRTWTTYWSLRPSSPTAREERVGARERAAPRHSDRREGPMQFMGSPN